MPPPTLNYEEPVWGRKQELPAPLAHHFMPGYIRSRSYVECAHEHECQNGRSGNHHYR